MKPAFEVEQIIWVLRDAGLEVMEGLWTLNGNSVWWWRVKLPEPQGKAQYTHYVGPMEGHDVRRT